MLLAVEIVGSVLLGGILVLELVTGKVLVWAVEGFAEVLLLVAEDCTEIDGEVWVAAVRCQCS